MTATEISQVYPTWRRWTVFVSFVVLFFGMPLAIEAWTMFVPAPSHVFSITEPTGQLSIYNANTRSFRLEDRKSYVPKDGDADTEMVYFSSATAEDGLRWRMLRTNCMMVLVGILYWKKMKRSLIRQPSQRISPA
jgi:hypothetical protein